MAGTNNTYVAADATWSVTFPDNTNGGTVSGISSCNSLSGTQNKAYPEYNNQITQGYQDGGVNCWCRMTSPVRSAWIFSYISSFANYCAWDCVEHCINAVHDDVDSRTAFYNSAGN